VKKLLMIAFLFIALLAGGKGLWASLVFPVHTPVNVTTTTTQVLAAKAGRKFLHLINDSDTVIYCKIDGNPAILNEGERLNANGGNLFMDIIVPDKVVNCIHDGTGNKVILATEG